MAAASLAPPALASLPPTGSRSADRLALTVPRHARVSRPRRPHPYVITASGYSAGAARLLVFLDYESCASSPAAERAHGAPSVAYRVSGHFSRASSWESGVRRHDHACAFLVADHGSAVLSAATAAFAVS